VNELKRHPPEVMQEKILVVETEIDSSNRRQQGRKRSRRRTTGEDYEQPETIRMNCPNSHLDLRSPVLMYLSVLFLMYSPTLTSAFLTSPPSSTLTGDQRRASTLFLQASSVRKWFSMVNNKRKSETNIQKREPIFFKRNPNEKKNVSDPEQLNTPNSTNSNTSTPINTWTTLLEDNNNLTSTSGMSSSSAGKRDVIQNGIFDPAFPLWHFPEYTATWANSFAVSPQLNPSNQSARTPFRSTSTTTIANNKISASLPLQSSSSNNITTRPSFMIPAYLKPDDVLTVADLRAILDGSTQEITTLRPSSPSGTSSPMRKTIQGGSEKTQLLPSNSFLPTSSFLPSSTIGSVPLTAKSKQGVAFPQASVLNYKSLQRGTAFVGGITGMILATTLLPNLWLVGLLVGGGYGYDLCSRPDEPPPSSLVARTLIQWGRVLSTAVLSVMDSCRALWFLYKTGELSYQYYKQYEIMDQRFAIQAKMDAWNTRFQEGKLRFDKWEQENEIGRTVLAGLRTLWLVDERSRRRAQKSRYRVIQSLYDGKSWVTKRVRNLWNTIRSSNWSASLSEYWKGIQTDLALGGESIWRTRLGAIVACWIAVNITGALFAISPASLAIVAVILGIVWPSWVIELLNRLNSLTVEIRARGRGDVVDSALQQLMARGSSTTHEANIAKILGRYDKNKYHYFRRADGSKRYYRTGQSLFTGRRRKKNPNQGTTTGGTSTFSWPWSKPQRVRRPPGKEQWGLFSR